MNNNNINPNIEVEEWKDKANEKIKNFHKKELGNFLEKEASRILNKYKINPKTWSPQELIPA
jgi:hypothetical protein